MIKDEAKDKTLYNGLIVTPPFYYKINNKENSVINFHKNLIFIFMLEILRFEMQMKCFYLHEGALQV